MGDHLYETGRCGQALFPRFFARKSDAMTLLSWRERRTRQVRDLYDMKECCYEEGRSGLEQVSMDLSLIQFGNPFGVEIL